MDKSGAMGSLERGRYPTHLGEDIARESNADVSGGDGDVRVEGRGEGGRGGRRGQRSVGRR